MTIREIVDLFVSLERQLVFSLKRNLKNHHAWEKEEGFSWPAWQAEKIRSIEAYRRQNKRIVEVYEPLITQETANLLREQYAEGYEQESDFLDHLAAEELPELSLPRATAEPPGTEGFFKVNHEKLDRLIDDIGGSLRAANHSTLRLMDDVYRKTIAKVEIALSTGAVTPWQAVDMATKDFLSQGINSITYQNGARVNIASYAEMALRTAATRAQLRGEAMKRQELGIDTVRVSQYGACSKTCLPWQGRVYIDDVWGAFEGERDDRGRGRSRDGSWYPLLSTALSGGLFHPNCRHTLTSYIKGISRDVPIMDEESCLRISKLEQRQRQMERQIRALKRLQDGSTDPQNIKNYARKSKLAQKKLREFIAENGDVLRRSPEREKNRLRGENSPEFQEKALRNDGDGGIMELGSDGTITMERKAKPGMPQPMPKRQLQRITKSFKKLGGIIQMGEETDLYLASKNAEAITYDAKTILLRTLPGRASVFEELIHTAQYRLGENDGSYSARLSCEIVAQEKLLRCARAYKLTDFEIEQTKSALQSYREEWERYLKKGE